MRRRPVGQSLEIYFLCHRSTLNYTNLQMAFNEEWNGKRSSFCTGILAVIPDPIHTRISTTILPTFCIFIFWQNETGSSLFLKPTTDAKVLGFLGASFSSFGVFVFEFWVLRFRDLGVFVFDLGCFVFEFWVLRFGDLGASFSRFRRFVLRSSFSSASFSKLPLSDSTFFARC